MTSHAPESQASTVPASLRESFDPRLRLVDRVTKWKSGASYVEVAQSVLRNKFGIAEIEEAHRIYGSLARSKLALIDSDDEDGQPGAPESLVEWLRNNEKSSKPIAGGKSRTFKDAAHAFVQYQQLCQELTRKTKKPKEVLTPAEFEKFKKDLTSKLDADGMSSEINKFVDVLGNDNSFANYYFRNLEPVVFEKLDEMRLSNLRKTEREIRELITNQFKQQELTIRLVITDIEGYKSSFFQKLIARWFFSWGINHTALQIGPYLVEWNDGELVIPRPIRSKGAVARFCFKPITMSTEDVITKISKVCVEYNLDRSYSQFGSMFSSKNANCQMFVEAIIDALGLEPSWSKNGPISHYLASVRSNELRNATDFVIWHGGDPPQTRIHSHPELRQFYNTYCNSQGLNRSEAFRLELEMMVKSIERCLQMQIRQARRLGDTEKIEKLWPNKDQNPPIFRPADAGSPGQSQSGDASTAPNASQSRPTQTPNAAPGGQDEFTGATFNVVPEYQSEITGDLSLMTAMYSHSYAGTSGSHFPATSTSDRGGLGSRPTS